MAREQIAMPSLMDAAEDWLDDSMPDSSVVQAPASETYPYIFEVDKTGHQQAVDERQPDLGH